MIEFDNLLDPLAACIVIGGTLIATLARSGLHAAIVTIRQMSTLVGLPFDDRDMRARLAPALQRTRKDGLIRTTLPNLDDPALVSALDALLRTRGLPAMLAEFDRSRIERKLKRATASGFLESAADNAPIFGLAGTLLALSQLPGDVGDAAAMAGIISAAVASTLYGILFAQIVCLPLARVIERRGLREEEMRLQLEEWLVAQIRLACSNSVSVRHTRAPSVVAA